MDHKRRAWMPALSVVNRVTGRRLQSMRAALFMREPLCRSCSERGFSVIATQRDHIVSLAEGGTDDDSNVQPLCDGCHSQKTLAEALRGRGLAARPSLPLAGPAALPVPHQPPPAVGHPGGAEISGAPQVETDPQVKLLCAGVSTGGVPHSAVEVAS